MPDLSNTTGSNTVGNNFEENLGVGKIGEDANQPVANTQQYVSSGPDKYIPEKEELLSLTVCYPVKQVAPLQEAIWLQAAPEPQKYLYSNFVEQGIQMDKDNLSLLNKVKDYFVAKDAGREPTDEAVKAFKERQKRYLAFPSNDNWKGPFIDFNDPSNVRKDALQDLEQLKSNVALNEMVTRAFAK